eukprot:CAMPEP_0114623062 /NCGR_PEP_ID=MMETSP0168-20121206/10054_1 /TAXON_ID=95228 ORGANISM="Vannella sp., Strain DIVA3 517/6/12" /NCGR_SAMPLE_ID=MMETSP0168 /ASSEMBLY_ACC=CAM_ASM_000044 /LENGTH=283 /DNA_ID=CAMNT_0001834287 /DNA_START=85 /DNA_END=932 /DNA_ORIENTATION=-
MGERKVINKYYAPDFDPSKLPKKKRPKNAQIKSRVMLPMTICCSTCHEFIYKGKKFNARKETVVGEDYLGLKIFRFYIKCTKCAASITFKTDPKNSDYKCEIGATRNYEPWNDKDALREEEEEKRKLEEDDAMAKLESKTEALKSQMDELDRLDELRSINKRQAHFDLEQILATRQKAYEEQIRALELQDEEELNDVKFHNSSTFIRRIDDSLPGPAVEVKPEVKVEGEVSDAPPRSALLDGPLKVIGKKPVKAKKKKRVIPGLSVAVPATDDDAPSTLAGLL